MEKFGVFNTKTNEMFKFDTICEAWRGYIGLLNDIIRETGEVDLKSDWEIVTIKDDVVVKSQRLDWVISED